MVVLYLKSDRSYRYADIKLDQAKNNVKLIVKFDHTFAFNILQ